MATIALLVGGAIVNALAFSGSNYLFSTLSSHKAAKEQNEEQKRHDLAVEKTQEAQKEWNERRDEQLDWVNEQLRRKAVAEQNFRNIDEAFDEYARVTGKTLHKDPYPQLSDYYTPSNDQKDRELIFIALGMVAIGLASYEIYKYEKRK